jgi:hypothetical protein
MLLNMLKSIRVICSATSTDLSSRNIFENESTAGGCTLQVSLVLLLDYSESTYLELAEDVDLPALPALMEMATHIRLPMPRAGRRGQTVKRTFISHDRRRVSAVNRMV